MMAIGVLHVITFGLPLWQTEGEIGQTGIVTPEVLMVTLLAETKTRQVTILLVDDDVDLREIIEEYLEFDGYHVILAADGSAGLKAYETYGADLIVSDYAMPGMNGVAMIAAIQLLMPLLPAILITGSVTEIDEVDCEAYCVLHKPFGSKVLLAKISSMMGLVSPLPTVAA